MTDEDVRSYLAEKGCCRFCCVRYVCLRSSNYTTFDNYIEKNGQIQLEESHKKPRYTPCVVCLGLLQNFTIDEVLKNPKLLDAKEYDSPNFTCSISMPVSILVREYRMKLDLIEKFPVFYDKDPEIFELPLNKAWKCLMKVKLCEILDKTFENSDTCNFSINIIMDYEFEQQELNKMTELQIDAFGKSNKKIRYTRKGMQSLFSRISPEIFKKYTINSLETPQVAVGCSGIECKHSSIYVGGRYCKFSRQLSQSPWIIDGVKTMETSVQELIFKELSECFNIPETNLIFGSSGREDCDVRCLGKGRPFYVEILDPKVTKFKNEDFQKVEDQINKSELIGVYRLQVVLKNDLNQIKQGEEIKTKEYIALCISKTAITQDQIDTINNLGSVELSQKTPIRVLHRRPLGIRKKKICQLKANSIQGKDNLFLLSVVTEAGTYVKEFVHGDFARTIPSIRSIINADVDLVALDVISINLDWPIET